jgi:hypothetical protein
VGFWFPPVYVVHLFYVLTITPQLRPAMEAIRANGRAILVVTLLLFFFVYLFSIIGFTWFYTDYTHPALEESNPDKNMYCDTLFECFISNARYGLTHGGGVAEVLGTSHPFGQYYVGRFFYDFGFFAMCNILCLNLILAIIIDSFGQRRSEAAATREYFGSACYICGIASAEFERHTDHGFSAHIGAEHNMWSYVRCMLTLDGMSPDAMDHRELYLWRKWLGGLPPGSNRTDFKSPDPFPIKRSLTLEQLGVNGSKEDGARVGELLSRIAALEEAAAGGAGHAADGGERQGSPRRARATGSAQRSR